MPDRRIRIGTVGAVNPLRRELRITPDPAHVEQFNQVEWLRVIPPGGSEVRCRVVESRTDGAHIAVILGPGVPRDLVGTMKGACIALAEDECAPSSDDRFEAADLVGFAVVDASGETLGCVRDTVSAGGNDVLEVEMDSGGSFAFPIAPGSVLHIDVEARQVVTGDLAPFRVDYAD